jgi:maleylacetoacetate isomerase
MCAVSYCAQIAARSKNLRRSLPRKHHEPRKPKMTAQSRFELYSYWRTSATYRVRVALNLKGLIAREHNINLDTGEQRSAAFLAINPMGAIPALIDNEAGDARAPLTQSLAILEYLDEIAPQPALLPTDAYGRARVRSLAAILATDTHPLITSRIKTYLMTNANFDDAAFRAWQVQWFTTGLQAFEQRLVAEPQTGSYCHGDTPTIADICLASIIVVMRVFKVEVANIPMITRIITQCETVEAFAKADPRLQVGAPHSPV